MPQARTALSGGFSISPTALGPVSSGSVFSNLRVSIQTQANALVDPSDTPTVSTLRVVEDAAGNLAIYVYSVTQAAWKGVQVA